MKICILSMQKVDNYGSLLQAYGLKKMLEELGSNVEFLDIKFIDGDHKLLPNENADYHDNDGKSKLKKLFNRSVLTFVRNRIINKAFVKKCDLFRREYLDIDRKSDHYDLCIIGSDEVFNCLNAGWWGYTSQLFGNIPESDAIITYAASCGATKYENEEEALNEAKKLESKTDTKESSTSIRKEIEKKKDTIVKIEDVVKDEFDTIELAQNKIKELEDEGYLTTSTIKQVIYNEENESTNNDDSTSSKEIYNHLDITLLDKISIVDDNGRFQEIKATMTVSKVTIDGKEIKLTGPSIDPNTRYMEYQSKNRRLNIKSNAIVDISGEITYKLNGKLVKTNYNISGKLDESLNVCGGKSDSKGFDLKYNSITILDNKVYVDANIVTKYIITGTMYKYKDVNIYYIDTTTTNYGFDYILNASYDKEIKELNYYFTYNEDVKTNKYQLSYDLKTYKFIEYANVDWIIEKQSKPSNNNTNTVEIPKTGIKSFPIILILIFPVLLIILFKQIKKKF